GNMPGTQHGTSCQPPIGHPAPRNSLISSISCRTAQSARRLIASGLTSRNRQRAAMCSIPGILDITSDPAALRAQALEQSRLMRHRGPDWSGVYDDARAILVHERLAIVGVDSGAQPLRSADGALALAVNGEIYNHRTLRAEHE